MLNAPVFFSFALTTLGLLGGCVQDAVSTSSNRADDAIAYGVAAARTSSAGRSEVSGSLAGAEAFFGEWVSQIVRRAPRGKVGPPWFYDSGVYQDAQSTELRSKLDLTLSEDGTYALITNFSPTSNDRTVIFGTWALGPGKVTLEQDGQPTWTFTYRGGKLLSEKDDGTLMVLGRR